MFISTPHPPLTMVHPILCRSFHYFLQEKNIETNEMDSLVLALIEKLKKASRNVNARLGFSPDHTIDVPLSLGTFMKTFGHTLNLTAIPELPLKFR